MATLRPARLLRRLAHSAGAPAPLHLVFGSHTIPHPEKASTGGEDAFFADDASLDSHHSHSTDIRASRTFRPGARASPQVNARDIQAQSPIQNQGRSRNRAQLATPDASALKNELARVGLATTTL